MGAALWFDHCCGRTCATSAHKQPVALYVLQELGGVDAPRHAPEQVGGAGLGRGGLQPPALSLVDAVPVEVRLGRVEVVVGRHLLVQAEVLHPHRLCRIVFKEKKIFGIKVKLKH